jgi:Tfp pilus assembly protein PilV
MDRSLESGISIIEICIATVIISIAAVIIITISKSTYGNFREARGYDAATTSAADKLAELSSLAIPSTTGNDTVVVDNGKYIRGWTIEHVGYLQRATVVVQYYGVGGYKTVKLTGALD